MDTTASDALKEVIPGYSSISEFTKDGYKVLMEGIKHSNALPGGRDWNFYATFDSFPKIINREGRDVLRVMNSIVKANHVESSINNRNFDEKTELVVEVNDIVLERVANNIDEMNGIKKTTVEPVEIQTVSAECPINESWNKVNKLTFSVSNASSEVENKLANTENCIRLITAKNIIRPQKFFKDKINNTNNYPWLPRITYKPNSLKPLAIFLEEFEDRHEFSHPYEFELDRFQPQPEQLVDEQKVSSPKPLLETPLIEIDKPEQLDDLVETLRNYKEIAVDVEHHSYRSFMGITCLMQISTCDTDYLIDTLALRDKLCILNEIFTNTSIIKIFHGADNDIEWLQRDLSLYVVNMFDTHQASKVMEYSVLSLAYLMKRFCNVVANKRFQLADWRIRPLPDELKSYARKDTHYLIFIYKMLKKELIRKNNGASNLLKSVIESSTEICKKRFFKPVLTDESHLALYRKSKKMFDNRQLYALKELYAWRDLLAREEDESIGYILPSHMLLQISETLPREMQGILACCSPIPPLVRSNLLELHHIVLKAREQPLEKPILKEDTRSRGFIKQISKVNVDSPLHCPHDLTKSTEFRDDLSTLLKETNLCIRKRITTLQIERTSSIYSVFNSPNDNKIQTEFDTYKKLKGLHYLSPFERYKLVKPFIQAEEIKAEEKRLDEETVAKSAEKEVSQSAAGDNNSENRTDEDRIASIRKHFLELNQKFHDEQEAKKLAEEQQRQQQSLISLGGSKKRKRELSSDEESCVIVDVVENQLHTPVPNLNKNQKRKWVSFEDLNNPNKRNKPNNNRGKKRMKNKRPKEQQYAAFIKQIQSANNNEQNVRMNQSNSRSVRSGPSYQDHSQDAFVPYDYSSVDFRQFQGGAGGSSSGQQFKSNFKTRGQRRTRNQDTRSSTFRGNSGRRGARRGGRGR